MTFEIGGKQHVAILSGMSRASRNRHNLMPELREIRSQTMLFCSGCSEVQETAFEAGLIPYIPADRKVQSWPNRSLGKQYHDGRSVP
jgi:hypothetical protein